MLPREVGVYQTLPFAVLRLGLNDRMFDPPSPHLLNRKTFTNFELSNIRLDSIYLFDTHQLIVKVKQIHRFWPHPAAIKRDGEELQFRECWAAPAQFRFVNRIDLGRCCRG